MATPFTPYSNMSPSSRHYHRYDRFIYGCVPAPSPIEDGIQRRLLEKNRVVEHLFVENRVRIVEWHLKEISI